MILNVILSLRTDFEENAKFFKTFHFYHIINDDLILRLYRSFIFSLNDKRI